MLSQLEYSEKVRLHINASVGFYAPYGTRIAALRALEVLNALTPEICSAAAKSQHQQWLDSQIISLSQYAHELSRQWWDVASKHDTLPLEDWLNGRELATIDDSGIVSGTGLHYELAQKQCYGNVAFTFRLVRDGASMRIRAAARTVQ